MTDVRESECGPISGDELRHVKRLCEGRLEDVRQEYGYTAPMRRRDVVLVYRMAVLLLQQQEAGR